MIIKYGSNFDLGLRLIQNSLLSLYNSIHQNPSNSSNLTVKFNSEQDIKQDEIMSSKDVSAQLLNDVTYTISPFIHVPFPQHKMYVYETYEDVQIYTKKVYIGENFLEVSYKTNNNILPSGIYPRRFFSYIAKYITQKRTKDTVIKIPDSKSAFIKEVLSVAYVPNSTDMGTINQQLKSFVNCLLTLTFSNPNDSARKNRTDISFLTGDHSWLWDDSKPWQNSINISQDIYDLIKVSAVPISDKAVSTFKSSIKLDIYNYFTYQNYNLYLKKLNHKFLISDIHYLFGSGTSELVEFRRIFKRIISEIKQISNLEFTEFTKYSFLLISNEESLLKKNIRKKTNEYQHPELKINEDTKAKLSEQYGDVDVLAAMSYVRTKVARGGVRHPHAYLKDVLRNPLWYSKERVKTINLLHETQYSQFIQLKESEKKILHSDLVRRIKITPLYNVSHDLELLLNQLKNPGKALLKIPQFPYCVYLYWASLTGLVTESNNTHNEKLLVKLFTELMN